MIDVKILEGKIAALQPSFVLMGEMTGKPATASVMGLYADYFATNHIAIDDANQAVEAIMAGWSKGWWPDPEQIAARAIELVRQEMAMRNAHDRGAEIEETMAQASAVKWERRLTMANEWRMRNVEGFRTVLGSVNAYCRGAEHLAWQQESDTYRKSFRDGCIVQACNNQAGKDERRAARIVEAQRHDRAVQFASGGAI